MSRYLIWGVKTDCGTGLTYGLVLERTQKVRTSNTRTRACPNFEHLELISKNTGRTRTSMVELRTSKKYKKNLDFETTQFFFQLFTNSKTLFPNFL